MKKNIKKTIICILLLLNPIVIPFVLVLVFKTDLIATAILNVIISTLVTYLTLKHPIFR